MLVKSNVVDLLPLSKLQEAILYEYLKNPNSEINFEQFSLIINGELNAARFTSAWQEIIAIHDVLRTCFRWENLKNPVQVILKTHQDIRILDKSNQHLSDGEAIDSVLLEDRAEKFDLLNVPFRASLVHIRPSLHLVIISYHHILYDGWSLSVLLDQFLFKCRFPDKQIQATSRTFKHFLELQKGRPVNADVNLYWKKYWENYTPKGRPANTLKVPYSGYKLATKIVGCRKKVDDFVTSCRLTSATFFSFCFGVLLQKVNDLDDVVFDTIRSIRPSENFERSIGLYISPCPVRVTYSSGETISEQLRRLQEEFISQTDLPFEEYSRNLSFDFQAFTSVLIIENYPISEQVDELPFSISDIRYEEHTKYDLTAVIFLKDEQILLDLTFNKNKLPVEFVEKLSTFFFELVWGISESTWTDYSQISVPAPIITNCATRANAINGSIPKLHGNEKIIYEIICSILPPMSACLDPDEDFFLYGINSFDIITLKNRLSEHFGELIPITRIFNHNSVRKLAGLFPLDFDRTVLQFDVTDSIMAISPQQRSILLHQAVDGEIYNNYFIYRVNTKLDVHVLGQAMTSLLTRHPILRTGFGVRDGEIVPFETSGIIYNIPVLQVGNGKDRLPDVPYSILDLDRPPLVDIKLYQSDSGDFLSIQSHHVILDGVSMSLLLKELLALYEGKVLDKPVYTYAHYCNWFEKFRNSGEYGRQRSYWLSGSLNREHILNQFSDVCRSVPATFQVELFQVKLQPGLHDRSAAFAAAANLTSFQYYMSMLSILFSQFLARDTVVFNISSLGRSRPEFSSTIGMFVNTLLIEAAVDKSDSVIRQLSKTKKKLVGAMSNEDYQFNEFLKELNINEYNDFLSSHNLYVNYLVEGVNYASELSNGVISLKLCEKAAKYSLYKLSFYFIESDAGLEIKLYYNPSLFPVSTIRFLMQEFLFLLDYCLDHPHGPISTIPLFSPSRIETIGNNPACQNSKHFPEQEIYQTIHKRFESIVKKFPDKIAVRSPKSSGYSYEMLNLYADRLSSFLKNEKRIQTGATIGLLFNQGTLEQFPAILGCLKAGLIYVPIDPEFPSTRINELMRDSEAVFLLTSVNIESAKLLSLNMSQEDVFFTEQIIENSKYDNPYDSDVESNGGAYILYTSGSTGKPKGVLQSHVNVLHYARAYSNGLLITETDTLTMLAKYNFDAAIMDIFGSLLNGAELLVLNIKTDFLELDAIIRNANVSIYHSTPTLYREFIHLLEAKASGSIRAVVLGGEPVFKSDFDNFRYHFRKGALFVNGFGPTESTIVLQNYLTHQDELIENNVPLGLPTLQTEVFIWDNNDNELPVFATGELIVKSEFLAVSYWKNEIETKQKFQTDPISITGRIYRSGDIGRRLPNGMIEYLGRRDSQVKINGYRIELGEIESALDSLAEVRKSVVICKRDKESDLRLIAYVVLNCVVEPTMLAAKLKQMLPGYMIPEAFLFQETFPLTNSGKIDRNALPDVVDYSTNNVEVAETEDERRIETAWSEVLGKPSLAIGKNTNFFDLGGNSVKLLNLGTKLNRLFSKQISVKDLFVYTTIQLQADYFRNSVGLEQGIQTKDGISDRVSQGRNRLLNRIEKNKRV